MPINKETPSKMHLRGETYVTLPSSTIAAVKDATALGIIAYLLDKPLDWNPRKTDICKQLSIGPAAWKKATEHLTELGLYLVLDIRYENGQFKDKIVSVSAVPDLNVDLPSSVNTEIVESAPIHITDSITHNILLNTENEEAEKTTEKKTEKKTVNRKTLIPKDWQPSLAILQRLEKANLKLENAYHTIDEFIAWAELEQREYKNWDLTFFNHCLRTQRYEEKSNGKQAGRKETGAEAQARGLQEALDQAGDIPAEWWTRELF